MATGGLQAGDQGVLSARGLIVITLRLVLLAGAFRHGDFKSSGRVREARSRARSRVSHIAAKLEDSRVKLVLDLEAENAGDAARPLFPSQQNLIPIPA